MYRQEQKLIYARYKFGLDKSYKRIWTIYDFQYTI